MQYIFTAILLALCDRFLKLYIIRNIAFGERVPFIRGVLDLTHVENTGAAFGRLQGMRWPLVAISAAAVIVIFALILTRKVRRPFAVWSLTLMAGGALGNLVDRLLYGRVVDMFLLTFVDFAIFNLADCFIDVGGIALCIYLIFISGREDKKAKEAKEAEKASHGGGGDG
jgi:signal peptidase II